MEPTQRTSITHPIQVGWLSIPALAGQVGLTFAPGKVQREALSGSWSRDLETDLRRLRAEYGARQLVCLLEDHELAELGIERLVEAAGHEGITASRLPMRDGSIPGAAAAAELVEAILGWARAGENVVVHCKGGLGRAGTIGGCVARAAGADGEEALRVVRDARGPGAPETAEQADFIRRFSEAPRLRSRIRGAVIGAAIGDALGHPTEFLSTAAIRRQYPPHGVTGFALWWERGGSRFAPYTDDTQMAEIVLRTLTEGDRSDEGLDGVMTETGRGFAEWATKPQGGHRAPGNACLRGASRLGAGVAWSDAGGAEDGGCGSVMRSYPFGLLFANEEGKARQWAVAGSRLTHQAPIALAASAAMAAGVIAMLRSESPFPAMIAAAHAEDPGTARMIEDALADASAGIEPAVTFERLQGWAAHEAIAAAAYVVARHPTDIRAALLEGANAPGDSDSIATLAGALLGARLGIEALPADWVRDVERSDELVALADRAAAAIERKP